ncbi:unnamed protein product [Calypogeia fissa]
MSTICFTSPSDRSLAGKSGFVNSSRSAYKVLQGYPSLRPKIYFCAGGAALDFSAGTAGALVFAAGGGAAGALELAGGEPDYGFAGGGGHGKGSGGEVLEPPAKAPPSAGGSGGGGGSNSNSYAPKRNILMLVGQV